jgi:hypothetical protein
MVDLFISTSNEGVAPLFSFLPYLAQFYARYVLLVNEHSVLSTAHQVEELLKSWQFWPIMAIPKLEV